uniref:Uncharacterized protein n=1 Tax=Amphimedon queenslandica TaxID=400682 RepID=A0A1X7ULR9_AMPQE
MGIALTYYDHDFINITNSNIKNTQFGIAILQGTNNEVHLVNITTDITNNNGIRFYSRWSIDVNTVHLTGVLITNSFKPALHVVCNGRCTLRLTNVTITNNSNTGIIILGKWNIYFTNRPSFISNNRSPTNGGGIWIDRYSSVTSSTEVYFINNTAQGMGGAIYVNEVRYSTFIYNHLTFKNFIPIFKNNSALVSGDNIYNGVYHGQVALSNEFLNVANCQNISFSKYVTSAPIGVCLCGDGLTVNCDDRSLDGVIYPGQSINLSLVTVGVCGGISSSVLVTSDTQSLEVVHVNVNQETVRKCKNFTYAINKIENEGTFQIGIRKSAANIGLINSQVAVSIRFMECPLGLRVVSGSCQCDNMIGAINGTHCDINKSPHHISRSGNNWLYYSQEYQCVVAHTNCPFDYCDTSTVHLSLNESDLQCRNGRSGILCGGCQPGLSLMLGSNQCQACSNEYLSLVAAFMIAGIALVVFLMVSKLAVSSGSINGLLFYANVVKLNEAALFSNGSIPVLSQFIAWLNLDLGIQTCFFNGLDSYWKTWLQFAFLLYIWLLIGIIIIGCNHSARLARLCGNNGVPPFIDAYTGPYKDQYRYWTGLLLIIRLLLTTVFSYTTGTIPEINNYIIAVVAAILLYKSRNVYRANKLNILEAFYLINLGVMAQLNAVSVGMNLHISSIVTSVSISLSMIPLIVIITLPVSSKVARYFYVRCSCIKKYTETGDEEEQNPLLMNEEELHSPTRIVMGRESMIFDFNITKYKFKIYAK